MAQIYNTISIISFSLAGIFLVFSIFCWIKFGILSIIGDFTGKTAKKSIEKIRKDNEKNGKHFMPLVNYENREAEKLETGHNKVTDDVNTDVLDYGDGATELLHKGTEVLNYNPAEEYAKQSQIQLEMLQSIVLIHTEETI